MGRNPAPHSSNPGFSNSAFMGGGNTPLAQKMRGLYQVQPLPPIAQVIQPIRPASAGGPFTNGISALTLPTSPLA